MRINRIRKCIAAFLAIACIASFMTAPAFGADVSLSIDVTRPAGKYDGTERANDFFLYGGSTYYSWVEYEVTVPETGLYQLDAKVAVSAGHTAQLKISVDGIAVDGIFDIAPSDTAWEVRSAMLHDSIPMAAGTRILKIEQAELISATTLNSLTLTKVGEFQPPITVDVTAPMEAYDGTGRTKDFHFYGGNEKNYSWVKYEVEVPEDGMYRPDIQITAEANKEGGMRMEIDGVMQNDILVLPADPANYALRTFAMAEIPLTAGAHVIRIYQTTAATTFTLNYLAFTKSGKYERPVSVTFLGSTATASTVESMTSAGDGYKERAQMRGGQEMVFDLSMPTGMYDVALLVSASEQYEGFVSVSVNGDKTCEEMAVPAEYATDADAKEKEFYEISVAEGVWFHSGDNTVTVTGGIANANLFYFRGIVVKPAEKNWVVKPVLDAFRGNSITAGIYAENNGFESPLELVLAIALYDAEGELLALTEKPYSVTSGVSTEETFSVTVPDEAVCAKAFVWGGTSIFDSDMMYYANVLEQTR